MNQTEYREWMAIVNGSEYRTVAKTEAKAKSNIRYQARQNGLFWIKSADIEIVEVA